MASTVPTNARGAALPLVARVPPLPIMRERSASLRAQGGDRDAHPTAGTFGVSICLCLDTRNNRLSAWCCVRVRVCRCLRRCVCVCARWLSAVVSAMTTRDDCV